MLKHSSVPSSVLSSTDIIFYHHVKISIKLSLYAWLGKRIHYTKNFINWFMGSDCIKFHTDFHWRAEQTTVPLLFSVPWCSVTASRPSSFCVSAPVLFVYFKVILYFSSLVYSHKPSKNWSNNHAFPSPHESLKAKDSFNYEEKHDYGFKVIFKNKIATFFHIKNTSLCTTN